MTEDKLEERYEAFKDFLDKRQYENAYTCLKGLIQEFPRYPALLEDAVQLSLYDLDDPAKARTWLVRLTNLRFHWFDHLLLSQVEATLDNLANAKKHLKKARRLGKGASGAARKKFLAAENLIRVKELKLLAKSKKRTPAAKANKKSKSGAVKKKAKTPLLSPSIPAEQVKAQSAPDMAAPQKLQAVPPAYNIPIKFSLPGKETLSDFLSLPLSGLKETRLLLDYTRLIIQGGFDELLCLNVTSEVDKYWYQIETVKRVLKYFRGRVLLCDEVGLGKTVEAGMLVKEYLMRGMAANVLVLAPPPLVSQWKEEMQVKFGIEFLTTDDPEFADDPEQFWRRKFIIASIHTAKSKKNFPLVTKQFYDIVVVDEAHHLRNRKTLTWKLVNQIKKKFIFLLTATPVQNNLIELYNLITLLKPGQFKTESCFKKEYVQRGNLRTPANREKLKTLLRDVMVRNTRSVIDLKLPQRFASTIKLEAPEAERRIYSGLKDYLREQNFNKHMVNLLLREAGSSPFALRKSLLKLPKDERIVEITGLVETLGDICKGKALVNILKKDPREKKIVFTQYLKSLDYLTDLLAREKIAYTTFSGNMSTRDKDRSIAAFKEDVPVLLSTESGGEGRNLQFCRTIINFDLPWNPMKIEQRIGRLHRIGQTRDVFIFNLSVRGTIEDYIIDILDSKINMFEMVIGEIEPILGHISQDDDFEHIIMGLWLNSGSDKELGDGFEKLGNNLMAAKKEYLKTKMLDEEIFGEDYEA